MEKLIPHIAIENGTLSNPYRFVEKGSKIDLTKDEAEFYKGTWLRPTKEGQKILSTPPFFPNINMTGTNGVQAMQNIDRNVRQSSSQYDDQMKVIIAAENKADGKDEAEVVKTEGEEATAGTGNLDPLA